MEIKTNQKIHSVCLSNDREKIILCLDNQVIEIWDVDNFTKIREFNLTKKLVNNLILTNDNKYLIFTDESYAINVWDYKLNKISLKIDIFASEISSIKESPDGKKIIVGCEDNNIKIWNFDGELIHDLKGHFTGITSMAISPNSKILLSGSYDYEIKIWDLETGNLLQTLEEHEYSINEIKISPSSNYFISISKEKIIKWDFKTKKVLKEFKNFSDPLKYVFITSDERYLIGASENKIVCFNFHSFEIKSIEEFDHDISFLDLSKNENNIILGIGKKTICKINFTEWLIKNKVEIETNDLNIRIPFKAYNGSDPYLFVSYTHKDKKLVYPEMQLIKDEGFNIWYDEGIPPTSEWLEEIENAILKCTLFLVFITPNAVESRMVRSEISYALRNNKKFLSIFLDRTELKHGLDLRLSPIQAILKYELEYTTYIRKLLDTLSTIFKNNI